MPKLTPQQLTTALQSLPDWSIQAEKLHREFVFPDFAHAIGFITIAAIGIDKADHHPEWFNVYNRVRVDLTTHDAGGISQKDIDLAHALDKIAGKLTQ